MEHNQQPYDSSMKALFQDDAAEIIPYLVPDATFLEVLDMEALRSPLRTDRVYRIEYHGQLHVLHLEFQAGADPKMVERVLLYHADLLYKYSQPIISMIIYLFHCSTPTPPFKELSGRREVLSFQYQVLRLWELEAQEYINKHAVSLYPLLPAMQWHEARPLLQAIDELTQHSKGDSTKLQQRLLWFKILLERAEIVVPKKELQKVRKRLNAFDHILEESDFVRKQRALGEELGIAKGKELGLAQGKELGLAQGKELGLTQGKELGLAQGEELGLVKGELLMAQQILQDILQLMYPKLAEQFAERVKQATNVDSLRTLASKIAIADDAQAAFKFLNLSLASEDQSGAPRESFRDEV